MTEAILPAQPLYGLILLKLSGELLAGDKHVGLDADQLDRIAAELIALVAAGIKVAVVIGGGNYFRGARNRSLSISTLRAHQMGMLFTIANAIALEQTLQSKGAASTVISSVAIPSIVDQFDGVSFAKHLREDKIVVFAGGTGCTHFTTDTAASLRAIEIKADILLKATDVDGIYNEDPALVSDALKFNRVTYGQVLTDDLAVMDATSIALCREHRMPLRVFNGLTPGNIYRAGYGGEIGTLVDFDDGD